MNKMNIHNKIKGALYGVAVGDALGGPLEFMSAEEIQKKHGGRVTEMIGGGWLDLEPGETTDDTAMTLAVAAGIVSEPDAPYENIGRRFIAWYNNGPKDIGNACASSISNAIINGGKWIEAAEKTQSNCGHNVEGNGALMRTIYPALYYTDETKRREVTRMIARMTHAGPQSTDLCELYVEAAHNAILGEGVELPLIPGREPTGYVLDSFNVAVEAIVSTRSFEEAIVEAVNRGGDADTIGAIAGGLAGAMYGYNDIPHRWISKLNEMDRAVMDSLAAAAFAQYQ